MNLIQLKLSNGDEILAEVVDDPEEDDVNIVARNCMKIISVENAEGHRFYTFRPWMTYQDKADYLQLINYTHIIGEAKPSEMLMIQYQRALDAEQSHAGEREELVEEILKTKLEDIFEDGDSDPDSNIVNLFGIDKSKYH